MVALSSVSSIVVLDGASLLAGLIILVLVIVLAVVLGGLVGGVAAALTVPLVSRGWGRLLPELSPNEDYEPSRHLALGVVFGVGYVLLGLFAWWLVVPSAIRMRLEGIHASAPFLSVAVIGTGLLGGASLFRRPVVRARAGAATTETDSGHWFVTRLEAAYLGALFTVSALCIVVNSML